MKIKFAPQVSFTERIRYSFKEGVIKAEFIDWPSLERSYMFIDISKIEPENECTAVI